MNEYSISQKNYFKRLMREMIKNLMRRQIFSCQKRSTFEKNFTSILFSENKISIGIEISREKAI